MNENLNLVEILKYCKKGTKLYSTVYGDVEFDGIENGKEYPVWYVNSEGKERSVTARGLLIARFDGECTLFPSKDQRDWSKFKVKKPKFDPKTLKPFDKVLVKKCDKSYYVWLPDFISLPPNDVNETVICMTKDDVVMAIPYNEETKHLVETNEEAPEFYRYWEE